MTATSTAPPSAGEEVRYLTRDEAAQLMRVSVETVKRAIANGDLRAKKTGANGGGRCLIRVRDLDAWFESLEDA